MSPGYKKRKKKIVRHGLADVACRELGVELDKAHQKADWAGEISPEMLEYAAKDSQVLLPLVESLGIKVHEDSLEEVLKLERRVTPAMTRMAAAGVPIDEEGFRGYRRQNEAEVENVLEELEALAPERPEGGSWNWNSWQQIQKAFGLLGVELPDTKKATLLTLAHPLAAALLAYRDAKRRVDVCSRWLDRAHGGRVYASWKQAGAETGRMSCSEPNLQNLHKEDGMRRFVRAPEGRILVVADYSQMELRIVAQLSEDAAMIEAFEKGEDLHRATAARMHGVPEDEVTPEQRSSAKAVGFGIVYGMTPIGLAARLGTDETEASAMIGQYFAAYPDVHYFLKSNAARALKTGSLRTPIGRIRRFGDASAMTRREREEVCRQAKNFPVQGACADGLKLALALLYEHRDECPRAVPILAVHDEIVVECAEEEAEKVEAWLKKAMVDGMEAALKGAETEGSRVPVEVETKVGEAWAG